ncbi:MAG: MarR family transcriptional regulator [Rhodopirellula sp.]|jgi:DNA-binding MarR family transcriptional regulator|uniref:MarR family transcriptional regulator n=1 Tax=Rhodopirellula europaea SH398 TaxID=1263868 RepID=M5SGH6_9BACT|nr:MULTISPECIES: MarR family transcriptional regulator [Rhodopirellula]EMI25279.1 MarR family transcriptional regulator [Rhodopirellula europaea SH398]MAP07483.1 MarR family transcriptional regulator [Rhodopirellula sp.]MCR9210351.1 MarR family transcriptional regulator [bacterium]|tara:strand:+ start:7842 stop:8294 length:453 start_codon:yes stop_codon:yes gene_type:complete
MHFDSESSPGFAIGRVAYLIRSGMAAVLKDAGWPFSPEETQTLITLSDAGEAVSMNELASRMIRDPTTVKRQLDRLVDKKFVERTRSSEDARIVMIALTRRGEQKLQTVLPVLDDLRKAAIKGLSKSELETTQNVLRKMQKNLLAKQPVD